MQRNQYTPILNLLSPALGFTAPFSIPGKLLIQQLGCENLGWNEALPEDMQINWRKWEKKHQQLADKISLDLCFKPVNFGLVAKGILRRLDITWTYQVMVCGSQQGFEFS